MWDVANTADLYVMIQVILEYEVHGLADLKILFQGHQLLQGLL